MTDWADEKAREWLNENGLVPAGWGRDVSLAVLLREVRAQAQAEAISIWIGEGGPLSRRLAKLEAVAEAADRMRTDLDLLQAELPDGLRARLAGFLRNAGRSCDAYDEALDALESTNG